MISWFFDLELKNIIIQHIFKTLIPLAFALYEWLGTFTLLAPNNMVSWGDPPGPRITQNVPPRKGRNHFFMNHPESLSNQKLPTRENTNRTRACIQATICPAPFP